LRPADANFDETYGRAPRAYGPDEVGSFPASDSPFGIADLTGNVWEWTSGVVASSAGAKRSVWYKGGSFYQGRISALSSNGNNRGEPTQRNVRIGLRVCADFARAR
jgi:formylglycine-generating enzyme required for sulfatase activity